MPFKSVLFNKNLTDLLHINGLPARIGSSEYLDAPGLDAGLHVVGHEAVTRQHVQGVAPRLDADHLLRAQRGPDVVELLRYFRYCYEAAERNFFL